MANYNSTNTGAVIDAAVDFYETLTASATEINYLVGVTSAVQTQLDAKAPIADPTFTGEIGIGAVNVSETELGILEGATVTTTELNYVDGVTSSIQTQIDGKAATSHTHTVSDVTDLDNELANLSTAEIDYLEALYATGVTDTEFDYLDGVTSNIQTQLDAKGTLSNVVEDTTPDLGGDLDYNSNGLKVTGQTVGGSDGDAVYLSGSNTWSQTDASAEATAKGAIGIRISATDVLTHGVYTTTGLTAGATYYLSETAGAITTTAPSTSASIVRVIGYALTTTELLVNTDQSYFENA